MLSKSAVFVLAASAPQLALGQGACECKYAGTTMPASVAAASGNPLYGTSCDYAWDSMPGTKYYKNDTECPPSQMCEKGCNFMKLAWCYVEPNCTGAASFETTLDGIDEPLAYSYEVCSNPYCWDPWGWDADCPGSAECKEDACSCLYAGTTIPAAAAEAAGNPLYGTSCDHAWDNMPGTKYYKNETECPESSRCEKGCNYLNLEWCYVQPGCKGAAHFNTTLTGVGPMAYSYDVCSNPYCWDPWGWEDACPGGENCLSSTCADVKAAYKDQGCCGNPSGSFVMTR